MGFTNAGLFLVVLLFVFFPSVFGIEAISHPQPTNVTTGETVFFNCTANEPSGEENIIEWYIHWDSYSLLKASAQDTGMLTADVYGPDAGRGIYYTEYQVRTNPDGSKIHYCTLEINDVTLNDTGYFGCTHRVDPDNNFRTLLAEKVKLFVVTLPDNGNPKCEQTDNAGTEFIRLTCSSTGGSPPASLVWYNDKDEMISQPQNHTAVYYRSRSDSIRQYRCVATHPGYQQPKACSISFDQPTTTTTTIITTSQSTTVIETTDITTATIKSNISSTKETILTSFEQEGTNASSTASIPIILTKHHLPPVRKSPERNFFIPIVIGASAGALFLLLLLIILLSLLCRRKKKKEVSDQEPIPVDAQELPSLESPTQPVTENPYAELGGSPPPPTTVPDNHDYDDPILKPWKYHPELLDMFADNNGFEGDIQDGDQAGATGYTPPSSEGVNYQEYDVGNIYATRL